MREPTSHERQAGQPWDASYLEGPAPWDVGCPQPVFRRLAIQASAAGLVGDVLDAGCGTGEHSLLAASLGHRALGVDVAETALEMARQKARERGLTTEAQVEFLAADALNLDTLGRRFQTVLDSGLFHTFDAAEREHYAASLASVVDAGGMLYVLCFSDETPDTGPHPITQADLHAAFRPQLGWEILSIDRERILTRFHEAGAPAWFARIRRI